MFGLIPAFGDCCTHSIHVNRQTSFTLSKMIANCILVRNWDVIMASDVCSKLWCCFKFLAVTVYKSTCSFMNLSCIRFKEDNFFG